MNEKTLYLQHESSEQLLHQFISQINVYLSLFYLNNLDFIPLHSASRAKPLYKQWRDTLLQLGMKLCVDLRFTFPVHGHDSCSTDSIVMLQSY